MVVLEEKEVQAHERIPYSRILTQMFLSADQILHPELVWLPDGRCYRKTPIKYPRFEEENEEDYQDEIALQKNAEQTYSKLFSAKRFSVSFIFHCCS